MKTKIKGFFKRLTQRENITALGMIIAIGGISLVLALAAAGFARYRGLQLAKERRHSAYEDEIRRLSGITTNLAPIPDPTAGWKAYENKKYNFLIKYPTDWQSPVEKLPSREEKFLLKISFENQTPRDQGNSEAFDVYIFSGLIVEPANTGNLVRKNDLLPTDECPRFGDVTLGQGGYPAREISVEAGNPCYKENFFYHLSKNGFTYDIVPRFGSKYNIEDFDEGLNIVKFHPLFFDIVSTTDLSKKNVVVETAKKVVTPPKVRYTAGASCAHKKDKPRYSKTKGKHMDEDCCPDPDEWPNPRCAYSGGGLGLMRSGPKK